MTTEEAIADIKAKVADIDATLEMDFDTIVSSVRKGEFRIKDGGCKIGVYYDCIGTFSITIDEMRGKLGARFALENVLKMLGGKEVNNG